MPSIPLEIDINSEYDGSGAAAAKRDMKEMKGLSGTLGKGFSDLQNMMSGAFKVGAAAAVASVAAIGAAVSGVAVAGVKDFMEFSNSMNEVFTLIPGTSQQAMDQMTQQVKDFATEFGVLPDKVVPALYQSLSAGVPQDNVFSFLETAQKAAVGGVTELETAVDGISSAVNAYGADVLSATEASDKMFTAVRLGKTDFGQLSGSLFNVVPVASALGVEFGDVAAGIAAITAQGVPTSVATTQMRQGFVELSKDGSGVATLFETLSGQTFVEFIKSGKNTQQALQLLEAHAKKTGVGVNDLFSSVEAGAFALALTGQGTETFTNNLAEMENSFGATNTAFDQMMTGLVPIFDRLRAAWQVALLDIGAALAPALEPVVTWLEGVLPRAIDVAVGFFETLGEATGTFFQALADGETPMTAFRQALGSILTFEQSVWLSAMEASIRGIVTAIDTATQPIQDFVAQWVSWKDVMAALGVVALTIVIPALAGIVAAAAPIVLTFGLLVGAAAAIRTAWETDFAGIRTLVKAAVGDITTMWNGLWQGLTVGNWSQFSAGFEGLQKNIRLWFMVQKLNIKTWANEWWTQFAGTDFGSELIASFNETMAILETSFNTLFDWTGIEIKLPRLDPNDLFADSAKIEISNVFSDTKLDPTGYISKMGFGNLITEVKLSPTLFLTKASFSDLFSSEVKLDPTGYVAKMGIGNLFTEVKLAPTQWLAKIDFGQIFNNEVKLTPDGYIAKMNFPDLFDTEVKVDAKSLIIDINFADIFNSEQMHPLVKIALMPFAAIFTKDKIKPIDYMVKMTIGDFISNEVQLSPEGYFARMGIGNLLTELKISPMQWFVKLGFGEFIDNSVQLSPEGYFAKMDIGALLTNVKLTPTEKMATISFGDLFTGSVQLDPEGYVAKMRFGDLFDTSFKLDPSTWIVKIKLGDLIDTSIPLNPADWFSGGRETMGPVVGSTRFSLDDFLTPEVSALFSGQPIPVKLSPDEAELLDFLNQPWETEVELVPKGGKGAGLKSLIRPEDLKVELEPSIKGLDALMTSGAKAAATTITGTPAPQWWGTEPGEVKQPKFWDTVPGEVPQPDFWGMIPGEVPQPKFWGKVPGEVPQPKFWGGIAGEIPKPKWWGTRAGYIEPPRVTSSGSGTTSRTATVDVSPTVVSSRFATAGNGVTINNYNTINTPIDERRSILRTVEEIRRRR